MKRVSAKEAFSQYQEDEFLRAANERLLAKREERGRLKAKEGIHIRRAGELASGLLKGIPVAYIKTPAGYMPLADAAGIVEIISATGEPGRRRIKLKIRRKEVAR